MISVIIATKDRAAVVKEIALPSLVSQNTDDFEVIIWDASENDATCDVVNAASGVFAERGIPLRYFRAPRVGLASQRNDSIKEARGDVVFFIDDDCEVSSDGIAVLSRYFRDYRWLKGAGLPLVNKAGVNMKYIRHPFLRFFRDIIYYALMGRSDNYRRIRYSTRNSVPPLDYPGKAEWLSGGDMAIRKEVFARLKYDETLEIFGGYAMGEDYDFTHRVYLMYRQPLLITTSGSIVHHAAGGGRIPNPRKKAAGFFFNTGKIRMNYKQYAPYKLLPFLWEQRVGAFFSMLMQGIRPTCVLAGYLDYRKTWQQSHMVKEEEKNSR